MDNNIFEYNIEELKQLVTLYPWFSWAREKLLYKVVEIEPESLDDFYSNNLIYFPQRDLVLFNAKKASKKKANKETKQEHLIPNKKSPVEPVEEVEELEEDDSKEVDLVSEKVVEKENFAVDFNNVEKENELSGEKFLEEDKEEKDKLEENECYSLMDVNEINEIEEIEFEKESLNKKIVVVGGDYFSQKDFDALRDDEKVGEIRVTSLGKDNDLINSSLKKEVDYDLPEFYTETLAKIYTEQEYYKEAIDVYAKLILLYPEKSAYFASLVKEIKLKN